MMAILEGVAVVFLFIVIVIGALRISRWVDQSEYSEIEALDDYIDKLEEENESLKRTATADGKWIRHLEEVVVQMGDNAEALAANKRQCYSKGRL